MLRMNIWGIDIEMLMLGMSGSFDRCNVRGECGNVRSECFDRCDVRSECGNVRSECFDRCNVRSECGNRGMLGMNALIGAI